MNPNPNPGSRHDLDDTSLGKYLIDKLPSLKLPVVSTKIGYGQSNPTYFVDDAANSRFILRKKPSGTIISPVAHQVDREFRVLEALGKVKGFPVPKVYCLCTDNEIIGTAFYVMEFVKGRIITDPDLGELSPSDRRKAIPPDSIGLQNYGKKTDFFLRHCNTYSRIEAQQAKVTNPKTGKQLGRAHEDYDEIVEFVRKNVPTDRYAIVHGDYKFDNVILHPTEPRVIALLDWELSTIGHPLMDAVYMVSPYWNAVTRAGDPTQGDSSRRVYNLENLAESGMPDPNELMDKYSDMVGWDPRKDRWNIAKIFHYVRGGTITHGIQARAISGQASSEFSHVYFEDTRRSLSAAIKMVRELKENIPTSFKL